MTAATLTTPTVGRPTVIDEPTFRAIWAELHPQIVAYMRRHVPAQHVEDVASQVFLKAWDRRATYRPRSGSIRAWIYTIAGSAVADFYRTAARRPQIADGIEPDRGVDDFAPTLADVVADRSLLAPALAQLADRQRQVLLLRYVEDRSVADTAQAMGTTASAVKSLALRALDALRALLAPPVVETTAEPQPPAPAVPDPARVALAELSTHITKPRSAHVHTPRRARRRPHPVRCGRAGGVGRLGLADRPASSPRTERPARPGDPEGRPRCRGADPRSPRPEAAGATTGRPRHVGRPGPGKPGLGAPHPPRGLTRTAGRIVSDAIAGAVVGLAVLAIVATFIYCLLTSAGSRRHTRDTLAAIDQGWNANTRAWRIWNRPPEPVIAVQETTVRIAPRDARAAWPQPIPQTVVDHVALHRADAGRHRASDGAQ